MKISFKINLPPGVPWLAGLLLVGAIGPSADAGPRTSGTYNITTDTVDSGGRRAASAAYLNDGSIGNVAGISTVGVPGMTVASGYIAQLSDTPPTIGTIANQTVTAGSNTGALAFTVGDAETPAENLSVTGSSSNQTLVPNANIVFGGSGANRTVTVTPASGQTGTATITVTVSDGSLPVPITFTLTVTAANSAPVFSLQPANQVVVGGGNATFTVAASGVPAPTFQWQLSIDGGTTWSNLTNVGFYSRVTTTSLAIASASAGLNGTRYRCVATNLAGAMNSNGATLSVNIAPAFTSANATAFMVGQAGSFTAVATGLPVPTLSFGAGPFPAWATFNTATGVLSGTPPSVMGSPFIFTLQATNVVSTATQEFTLTVNSLSATATHSVGGAGYLPGGTVTINNVLTYTGSPSSLGWHVVLPVGWSFVADTGSVGETKPAVGDTELLDWAWTAVPAGPVAFSYTLHVPAGDTGNKQLAALVIVRQSGTPTQVLAQPDPLVVYQSSTHSTDTDRNFRLSLLELTRVIELYNVRNGTVRTGCYKVQDGTEDGFGLDPARAATPDATLSRYHSADTTPRDGKVSLLELTRVIELFNYRSGTVRTGQYHVLAGTEDGFAPGP